MMVCGFKVLGLGSSSGWMRMYIHYIYTYLDTTYIGLRTCIYIHRDTPRRTEFQSYEIKKVKKKMNIFEMHAEFSFTEMKA